MPFLTRATFDYRRRLMTEMMRAHGLDALAFTAMRRSGDLTLWSWLRSLSHRQRFPIFSVADPLPSVFGLLRLPGRVRARIGRTSETTSSPDAALS